MKVSLQRWDSSLKLMAEAYAAKCIWNHNPELEETGENLYAGTGPLDFAQAVEKWFMEHLDYDFQNNTCDEVKMCGHYTQMVWADTHRVGCAFHLCDKMDGLDWEDRTSFLVCNYFPAGNYEGVRPYVEGDWCSRCPENLQKCENNLCAPDLVDEDVGGDDHGTETDFVPTFPEELGDTETTHPPTEPDTTLVQTEPTEEEHTPTPGATAARVQPQDVLSSAPAPEPEEEEEE
ncbi:peptidase inhibitor 16, partial [Nematolebias whitei]|uniref:peptidase inhibitor 16 n=1 Tax=Nematolebias whitei TaxID=451745 RepID=UPI0018984457